MRESLPGKLHVLRARQGLTLIEAAEKIGIGRDTLSELERGRRHPLKPTLAKIAEGYGVPIEALLSDEEEPALKPEETMTEHPEMRNTRFGEVLAEMLEERGIEVTPDAVGDLAKDVGLDSRKILGRMARRDAPFAGELGGLADVLELTREEMMRLAFAYTFEIRQL